MTTPNVLAIDAMGGDDGPPPMIEGVARAALRDPALRFSLHGDAEILTALVARHDGLAQRVDIHHCTDVIPMDAPPAQAVRGGRSSTLAMALRSVSSGEARSVVSAGNTGAIVALAVHLLKRAQNVQRPAIAVHWPADTADDFNVVLDMGADVRAEAETLVAYAIMGAFYRRAAFGTERPRVGLLNIGSEDFKGRPELHEARDRLLAIDAMPDAPFRFVGHVEGTDIVGDMADVIVTDGFTGNIAMKASEGTASFVRARLREGLMMSLRARIGGMLARPALTEVNRRIDPRRVNGGVLLGLNGIVVKSHGSADAVGHGAAISLAAQVARADMSRLVSDQLANIAARDQTDEGCEGDGVPPK